MFTGIPISRGLASGKVFLIRSAGYGAVSDQRIPYARVAAEVRRLEDAFAATKLQITALMTELQQQVGDTTAAIMDGHLMMIDDPFFRDSCKKEITAKRHTAEWAVNETARKTASAFASMDNAYLRERFKDVDDIVKRILRNLQGNSAEPHQTAIKHPCILVADELLPSETLSLPKQLILGIASDHGSVTSHASLLARVLGIPAVVGLGKLSEHTQTGDSILLDGSSGVVIINPDRHQQQAFGKMREQEHVSIQRLDRFNQHPGATRDGHPVPLLANVDYSTSTEQLTAVNAEGIGLFRSEYQWLSLNREPTENEQYEAYLKVGRVRRNRRNAFGETARPVIIRTWDLGGDKIVLGTPAKEANPFLGNRSIRFLLNAPSVFRRQLRAILRASAHESIAVMYPMISTLEELRAANHELTLCMEQLRTEGVAFDPAIQRGVMIEVPAAAHIAGVLGKEADFFSIGSNDLIQYTLAVDRLNETVAHLYQPTHPAILSLIDLIVHAGRSCGIPVSLCGEMASDPVLAVLLVGLGVSELS
ncbi:MAG: phosphoenolpyruvate--protein phosphotransferase, partial [Kiritimatiellaeota bacterium]|nr:phosphoenolpyruvate--protein phosphotransferase [Kiritimatiellota bacterium]